MVYTWQGEQRLHPIVEINARKTMGWVALQLQNKLGIDGVMTMRYEPKGHYEHSLLPYYALTKRGGKITLPGGLICDAGN